jgi:hypothetical protein
MDESRDIELCNRTTVMEFAATARTLHMCPLPQRGKLLQLKRDIETISSPPPCSPPPQDRRCIKFW